jgi:hypothetical protein
MTRTASLIAKIAFVLYSIVAIGAVSLALVFPPWRANTQTFIGLGALFIAAAPWSIVGMFAILVLEHHGVRFPPGIDMDAVVSGIYGGFIFLNLYFLYRMATERARERPEHAADVDVHDAEDIGTLQ